MPSLDVLQEVARQGERILAFQNETKESIQRRGGDLLRLSVATLGGVIIVGGILSAAEVALRPFTFVAFSTSVFLLVLSTGLFALMLAGVQNRSSFAYGPDMRVLAAQLGRESLSPNVLLASIIESQPDWIDENEALTSRIQRMAAVGLGTPALGVVVLLVALIFMLGGPILG